VRKVTSVKEQEGVLLNLSKTSLRVHTGSWARDSPSTSGSYAGWAWALVSSQDKKKKREPSEGRTAVLIKQRTCSKQGPPQGGKNLVGGSLQTMERSFPARGEGVEELLVEGCSSETINAGGGEKKK